MLNAIGIDFGTNYCRNAYLNGRGPQLIRNELDEWLTPAWVRLSSNGRPPIVGYQSKPDDYSPTQIPLTQIKSRLAERDALWSGQKMHTPAEIACWLFQALRRDAEHLLSKPVRGAVVAVPALASNLQRATTREAVQQAGLTTVRLISEPTAAVTARHMLNRQSDGCTLVYSLGAGYFEVAIIEIRAGAFKTLSIEGDRQIGGNAFDRQIRDYVLAQLFKTYKVDLRTNSALLWRLADLIEAAKIDLSSQNQTEIIIANHSQRTNNRLKTLTLSLTRSKVEDLLRQSIEQTLLLVQRALNVAKLSRHDIDEILLVGGSTQIPLVQERLREQFHKELVPTADGIIAQGAALQTAYLEAKERDTSTLYTPAKPIPAENEATSAADEAVEWTRDQDQSNVGRHKVRRANSFFGHFSQKMNFKLGVFFMNRFLRSTPSELLQAEHSDEVFSSLEQIYQNIQELLAEKHFMEGTLKKAELIAKSAKNTLSRDDLTSAIEVMERGLTYNRHHRRMHREVGHLYFYQANQLHKEDKAKDLLDFIQRTQPYESDGTWKEYYQSVYAKSLVDEGEWLETIEYFEELLKFDPENEQIRHRIANCYMNLAEEEYKRKKLLDTYHYFQMVRKYNPEHPQINGGIRVLRKEIYTKYKR